MTTADYRLSCGGKCLFASATQPSPENCHVLLRSCLLLPVPCTSCNILLYVWMILPGYLLLCCLWRWQGTRCTRRSKLPAWPAPPAACWARRPAGRRCCQGLERGSFGSASGHQSYQSWEVQPMQAWKRLSGVRFWYHYFSWVYKHYKTDPTWEKVRLFVDYVWYWVWKLKEIRNSFRFRNLVY